jgi:lysophospholipase L1-like esterase
MIACLGDSITAGRPGVSYLRYFKNPGRYKNYGLGGDTLTGLSHRIDTLLETSHVDEFIIEIGTNDILLPFLREYSLSWKRIVDRLICRGSVPVDTIELFTGGYKKLIKKFTGRQLTIISIPCLGEERENELNKKADEYNYAIRNLCTGNNITFIDFNRWQKETIQKNHLGGNRYFMTKQPFNCVIDTIATSYLGLSARVSRKRNLVTTVDGIHLNEQGARGLASLIIQNMNGNHHGM